MMLLTAVALGLVLQQPQQPSPITLPGTPAVTAPKDKPADSAAAIADVGTQEQIVLSITKHIAPRYNPSNVPVNGYWAGAQQQDITEGQMSFAMHDSTWNGQPCKYFEGRSDFEYHPNVKNKKVLFKPRLYVFAQLTPSGRLLHMNTAYNGFGAPVQIDAVFNKDSVDITKTVGVEITKSSFFPTFSMDLFDHLFDPFFRDGLVVNDKDRQIAFFHPITGAPCTVTASLRGRFMGEHEYRKYEGYKVEVTSPDTPSKATTFITRQGEMLQVLMPENQDAIAYSSLSPSEERNWGKFMPGDWDKPASVTQPYRTRYRTFAIPVLLTNPTYMLMPLPFAVAL